MFSLFCNPQIHNTNISNAHYVQELQYSTVVINLQTFHTNMMVSFQFLKFKLNFFMRFLVFIQVVFENLMFSCLSGVNDA